MGYVHTRRSIGGRWVSQQGHPEPGRVRFLTMAMKWRPLAEQIQWTFLVDPQETVSGVSGALHIKFFLIGLYFPEDPDLLTAAAFK